MRVTRGAGRANFDDVMLTRDFSPTRAYSQSKLAEEARANAQAYDAEARARLWALSESLTMAE